VEVGLVGSNLVVVVGSTAVDPGLGTPVVGNR
jgi:hypothetical protein